MRIALRYTILLSLVFSVLLGSVGIALTKQFCEVAGLRPYAVSPAPDACCEDTENSKTDDCCKEHISFQKLEPVQEHKQYHLSKLLFAYPVHTTAWPTYTVSIEPHLYIYKFTNNSPPLYGRQLLHFLHTLIV